VFSLRSLQQGIARRTDPLVEIVSQQADLMGMRLLQVFQQGR